MEAGDGGLAWRLGMEAWHGGLAWRPGMEAWHGGLAWRLGIEAWHGGLASRLVCTKVISELEGRRSQYSDMLHVMATTTSTELNLGHRAPIWDEHTCAYAAGPSLNKARLAKTRSPS